MTSTDEEKKMNFGNALDVLEQGGFVLRTGWNGENQYLKIMGSAGPFTQPVIVIKNPSPTEGFCVPWTASQTDMIARDWYRTDGKGKLIPASPAEETPPTVNPVAATETVVDEAETEE